MKDYQKKTNEELTKEIRDNFESLRNFRFGISGSKTKNMKEGRNLKKQIAKLSGEISMRKKLIK